MKKMLFVLMFMTGISYGANPTVIEGGETATYTKITVSSTTATSLSAYSSSRLELMCVNASATEVYISSAAGTFGSSSNLYEVGAGTSTRAVYITKGREAVFGSLRSASAGTGTIYCVEHR